MAYVLGTKPLEELTEMFNQKLLETHTAIKEICIAKVSKGRNIAIQPVDSTEAQKLRVKTNWINWIRAVFGGEAELITKSYGVVAQGVSIHKVNPKNKEASIQS